MDVIQITEILQDAALGALLGACVGDAAGAVLEFRESTTQADVDWAMNMPGGGVWGVAPGQITDDSELMLCLAQALAESPTFELERIARNYAAWIDSPPFDIGTTTSRSLGSVRGVLDSYAATMSGAAACYCMESKSNGSLMRATPLGVWGRRLPTADLANCARQDSCLSHPNGSCWQAVACYAIAIAHLMNHLGHRLHPCLSSPVAWHGLCRGAGRNIGRWRRHGHQCLYRRRLTGRGLWR